MSAAAGRVTYHGITLPFQTSKAEDETVWSDDRVDLHFVRRTVTVTSVVSSQIAGFVQSGESFADALSRVRHALEQPRKALRVEVGGDTIIDLPAGADAENGPRPQVLLLDRLVGECAVIQFRVTCSVVDCVGGNRPAWLSNRWDESVGIDDELRTTRTRRGRLVVRSDFNASPDSFRHLACPPIPQGFIRLKSEYDVSRDGLSLGYTFVDEEQFVMPPPPAARAQGTYRRTTANGAALFAEMQLTLTGDVATRRDVLLATAVVVALAELEKSDPAPARDPKTGRWLITGGIEYTTHGPSNKVSVHLKTRLAAQIPVSFSARRDFFEGVGQGISSGIGAAGGSAGRRGAGGGTTAGTTAAGGTSADGIPKPPPDPVFDLPGQSKGTGTGSVPAALERPPAGETAMPKGVVPVRANSRPLGSEPAVSPDPGLRGTAGLRLVAAALRDPCLAVAVNELRGGPLLAGAPSGDAPRELRGSAARPPAATVNVVDQVADRTSPGAATFTGGVYTDQRLVVTVEEDLGIACLPEQVPGGRTRTVRLSAPTVRVVVDWVAERAGDPPDYPDTETGDDNLVYLGRTFSPPSVELADDGATAVWRARGTYRYVATDPAKVEFGATMTSWVAEAFGLKPVPVFWGGPVLPDLRSSVQKAAGGVIVGGSELSNRPPPLVSGVVRGIAWWVPKLLDWVRKKAGTAGRPAGGG